MDAIDDNQVEPVVVEEPVVAKRGRKKNGQS